MEACWHTFCTAGDCDGLNHVDVTGYTWAEWTYHVEVWHEDENTVRHIAARFGDSRVSTWPVSEDVEPIAQASMWLQQERGAETARALRDRGYEVVAASWTNAERRSVQV